MPEKVQRSEIVSWTQNLVYSDENVKMVMSKVKQGDKDETICLWNTTEKGV